MTRPSPAELAGVGAPVLYSPQKAAEILPGKTAYWLKFNARKEKIPCTRVGRTIMFSPADLSEIARAGARKPKAPVLSAAPTITGRQNPAEGTRALKARTPRRKQAAA